MFKSETIVVLDDDGHSADIEVKWLQMSSGKPLAFISYSSDEESVVPVYSDEIDNLIKALQHVKQEMEDYVRS